MLNVCTACGMSHVEPELDGGGQLVDEEVCRRGTALVAAVRAELLVELDEERVGDANDPPLRHAYSEGFSAP